MFDVGTPLLLESCSRLGTWVLCLCIRAISCERNCTRAGNSCLPYLKILYTLMACEKCYGARLALQPFAVVVRGRSFRCRALARAGFCTNSTCVFHNAEYPHRAPRVVWFLNRRGRRVMMSIRAPHASCPRVLNIHLAPNKFSFARPNYNRISAARMRPFCGGV